MGLAPHLPDILRQTTLRTLYQPQGASDAELLAWFHAKKGDPASALAFHSALYDFKDLHEEYREMRKSRGMLLGD